MAEIVRFRARAYFVRFTLITLHIVKHLVFKMHLLNLYSVCLIPRMLEENLCIKVE